MCRNLVSVFWMILGVALAFFVTTNPLASLVVSFLGLMMPTWSDRREDPDDDELGFRS